MYSSKTKDQAKFLRSRGKSLSQISSLLNISKSTISGWVSDVVLNTIARKNIIQRVRRGNRITKLNHIRVRKEKNKLAILVAETVFTNVVINKYSAKLLCSMLFWGEGGKTESYVSFINSDPKMIKVFIELLKASYDIEDKKLRALIHVHQYHSEKELKKYWSKITDIPLSQFSKSYKKPNTGKRKKIGYMGSCRVRYYDAGVARELTAIYNELVLKLGALVNW